MQTVAVVLGIIVSVTVLVGAAWGGLWAVNAKVLKFRDWLKSEIGDTVKEHTETLRPNGGRSVGDLPDLVHRMRRENDEQHAHIGDRLTVVETRTERLLEDREKCECEAGRWQQVKRAAHNIQHAIGDSE